MKNFFLCDREYAEEIESRLCSHGLITSIILLREDYTLVEAVENAARLHCLYGIVVMPMHEERRTASFHILHGETEGSNSRHQMIILMITRASFPFRTSQLDIGRWSSHNHYELSFLQRTLKYRWNECLFASQRFNGLFRANAIL